MQTVGRSPGQPKPVRVYERPAVVVPVGLVLIVILGGIYVGLGGRSSSSPAVGGNTTHTVVYQADGSGARGVRTVNYTLTSDDGGTRQGKTNLPMKSQAGQEGLSFFRFKTGDFVYLSVQNQDAAGSVTCRIVVDGKIISENTSDGGYAIAGCKGSVPR